MRFALSLVLATVLYVSMVSFEPACQPEDKPPPLSVMPLAVSLLPALPPLPEPEADVPPAAEPPPPVMTAALSAFVLPEETDSFNVRPTEKLAAEPEVEEPAEEVAEKEPEPDRFVEAETEPPVEEEVAAEDEEEPDEPALAAEDLFPTLPEEEDEPAVEEKMEEREEKLAEADDADSGEAWEPTKLPKRVEAPKPKRRVPPEGLYAQLPKNLAQLPDLVIDPPRDHGAWRRIDRRFGIRTVAYAIDGREPAVYLIWEADGTVRRSDSIDRAGFSNRCRNRSHIDYFRRELAQARRQFNVARPMRIVGLVPAKVDRQFAAAQLDAIQQAGAQPQEVLRTVARYDLSAENPFGMEIAELVKDID